MVIKWSISIYKVRDLALFIASSTPSLSSFIVFLLSSYFFVWKEMKIIIIICLPPMAGVDEDLLKGTYHIDHKQD